MKKILLGLTAVFVAVLVFGNAPKAQAVAVSGKIQGKVTAYRNSTVNFTVTNHWGPELKRIVVWVPSTWIVSGPGNNTLVRNNVGGPWSVVYVPNGASQRSGYNAMWYKATTGITGLKKRKSASFPLTIKSPTSERVWSGKKVKVYWQADDGKGNFYRGSDYLVFN